MISTKIKVLRNQLELSQWRRSLSAEIQPGGADAAATDAKPLIGLVTTMGALHKGHLHLIAQARRQCRHVLVSIFVNPTQFAPTEDLDRYPRPFERDLELCKEAGVDAIFHPTVDVIYPNGTGETTMVIPPPVLNSSLYGACRPQFFCGVATVVLRLFNLVQPQVAYFGEKDYQQLLVVKTMVRDFHLPVEIVGVDIVREPSGLASSSRNVYLSDKQASDAIILYSTLKDVRERAYRNPHELQAILTEGGKQITSIAGMELKYLAACDVDTLEPLSAASIPMVLLVAVIFNGIWLIDTLVVRD